MIHKEIAEIVKGLIARRKFVYLCTNALLVEKKIDLFEPSPYLTFSIHLDGLREHHDRSVCQDGVFDRAVAAIRLLRARGFRVNVNATLFDGVAPETVADFFDYVTDELGVEGITVSPGYAYERAPDQEHFLNRRKTKELFRAIFRRGQQRRKRAWQLSHSSLYLDFLAGNQQYRCTPWGNPTRNVFGWQRPCYLLAEGYASSFKELMAETDWDSYGTGNYEKCANCMAHCGYEATAVSDAIVHPLKALRTAVGRIRTEGPMAPEIPLDGQRPAAFVHDQLVSAAVAQLPERQRPRASAATPRSAPRCGPGVHRSLTRPRGDVKAQPGPARRSRGARRRSRARALCRARRSSAIASPRSRKRPPEHGPGGARDRPAAAPRERPAG